MSVGPRTIYEGPSRVSSLEFGGRTVRVARPSEPDRLLEGADVLEWNRRDDYMPYWAYLWPGAFLLAEAVASGPWLAGVEEQGAEIEALEIGCGLGLAGLVGLARGLRVTFSDYDRAPFEFVERSARENGFAASRFATRILDWRKPPDERFQVVLGADVIYEPRLVPLVADVLSALLPPCGLGLIASPYRVAARAFPAAVEARGMACRSTPAAARDEHGRAVRGTIHRVTRRDSLGIFRASGAFRAGTETSPGRGSCAGR